MVEVAQISLVVGLLLLLIPLFITLRNYLLIRQPDYLLMSLIICLFGISMVFTSRDASSFMVNLIAYFFFSAAYVFTYYIKGEDHVISPVQWIIHVVVVFFYSLWYELASPAADFLLIRFLLFESLKFVLGVYLFQTMNSVIEIKTTPRVRTIKSIWKWFGAFLAIISVLRSLLVSIVLFKGWFMGESIQSDNALVTFGTNLVILGGSFLGVVIILTAVVFPETMLLTKHQILRADRLYEVLEKINEGENPAKTYDFLRGYLHEIRSIVKGGKVKHIKERE